MSAATVSPAKDARSLLAANVRLFHWYAKKHVPPGLVEDVVSEAAIAFLRFFDPARCEGASGFVRIVVRSAAHKFRTREALHTSRRHECHGAEAETDGTENLEERRHEMGLEPDELGPLERALDQLDDRSRSILALRFGLNGAEELSLRSLGARLGVSGERVSQLEHKALKRLRELLSPAPDTNRGPHHER
ncbi:sporulation sigma factor : Sporulation sigma factor SigE OS=Anoxybacillus sp. KU2-6(11) GN=JS80_02130 PE=4 SV=1: Sigma70_r4 [Gemmata massiliana]|uniref:RNA polymerase sigma-70 region 4 domain-containing protein n=1 Tax=Gemmata massiliana TaxID=1210884 RepID=A0A6P2DLP6_9BACT|nr:sigma-70 family RNA polymerase sigma factor [Gemmata massiliana]VTS03794.1 sporulation sigma factor : Sporulation sigma factor SigE OS=Anoxybacillus sp. KU2-6(11) GN=JS80_02130 PE=4 SV=1: Sigma70_r4 [Gemmata massiliana]